MKLLLHILAGKLRTGPAGSYAACVRWPADTDTDTDTDSDAIVLRDPQAVRALAHPARVAVLHRLLSGEVLTATECAEVAGLTPSAMSYHLRALQRWGLVDRADPTGDGRERPWRALGRSLRIESGPSPTDAAAMSLLFGQLLDTMRTEVMANVDRRSAGDAAARPASFLHSSAHLTDDEANELYQKIETLMEEYERRPKRAPGSRLHHLWWAGLPVATRSGRPDPAAAADVPWPS